MLGTFALRSGRMRHLIYRGISCSFFLFFFLSRLCLLCWLPFSFLFRFISAAAVFCSKLFLCTILAAYLVLLLQRRLGLLFPLNPLLLGPFERSVLLGRFSMLANLPGYVVTWSLVVLKRCTDSERHLLDSCHAESTTSRLEKRERSVVREGIGLFLSDTRGGMAKCPCLVVFAFLFVLVFFFFICRGGWRCQLYQEFSSQSGR